MKTKSVTSLPVLTLPRLCSKLENLTEHLARFCEEFGIARNETFPKRLAAIAFVNAVLLHRLDAAEAANLENLLAEDAVPAKVDIDQYVPTFLEYFTGGSKWVIEIQTVLTWLWSNTADAEAVSDPRIVLRLRTLHAIRAGLVIARELPEAAESIAELNKGLGVEHSFLSALLLAWSENNWEPYAAPFIEFVSAYYRSGSIEQVTIRNCAAEVIRIARALRDPWALSFWVETGWSGGRNFARRFPDRCKALLVEAGDEGLKNCHELYRRYILGTIRGDGEVQIEKATLRFFGEHEQSSLARNFCTGRDPRHTARVAFDFAAWMGIFSSYPVPVAKS